MQLPIKFQSASIWVESWQLAVHTEEEVESESQSSNKLSTQYNYNIKKLWMLLGIKY
jgi:hypothetical protein